MDITSLLYLIIVISQLLIFLLCSWWAFVYPKRSVMFVCFTILSFGILCNFVPCIYVRLGGVDAYIASRDVSWWMYRHLPLAIISVIILGILASRVMSDDP